MTSTLILIAAATHLGAFVSYPQSGRFGITFLLIAVLLWSGLAGFIGRAAADYKAAARTALAVVFALACAFSALSFLPQKDGVSALRKFSDGKYPDRTAVYFGLLRLGVSVPRILPPKKEEPPL